MKSCFVIMPFGGYFDGYYKDVIKPALKSASLTVKRSDEIYSTNSIIEDIFNGIVNADLIVADLTGKNPNVNYELGFAHALEKPVIIITQDIEDIPFDTKHIRAIKYNPIESNWQFEFKSRLIKTVSYLRGNPSANLVWQDSRIKVDENLLNFLLKMSRQFECVISKESFIEVDSNSGSSLITQIWEIETISSISHLYHSLHSDGDGNIEIIEVLDLVNHEICETVVYESDARHKSYFILFKNLIPHNSVIRIKIIASSENYIQDLLEKGTSHIFHTNTRNSKITFKNKRETYIFDNILKFENLSAEYINHPDQDLRGTKIFPELIDNKLSLRLDFSSDTPVKSEFGAVVTL